MSISQGSTVTIDQAGNGKIKDKGKEGKAKSRDNEDTKEERKLAKPKAKKKLEAKETPRLEASSLKETPRLEASSLKEESLPSFLKPTSRQESYEATLVEKPTVILAPAAKPKPKRMPKAKVKSSPQSQDYGEKNREAQDKNQDLQDVDSVVERDALQTELIALRASTAAEIARLQVNPWSVVST